MCGIVAIISKRSFGFVNTDLTIFEQLLYADVLRGPDATGVITADKYGSFWIDKEATDSHDFLQSYSHLQSRKEACMNGVALIGHNRKATVGAITDETAHPFVVNDRFAMVHNGTLWNHEKLHKTTVDSEALAMVIEEALNRGTGKPIDNLGDAISDVFGAYACVWYNQETEKVQFFRNSQRPLWIAEGDDAWYLSSEGALLHWILVRNSIKYKELKQIEEHKLYTLTPAEKSAPLVVEDIVEKKSEATTPTTHTGGSVAYTGNPTTIDEVSKNKFKRMRKHLIGQKLEFYVEDSVEKYLFGPQANEDEFLIMGTCDKMNAAHVIKGEVSISKQQLYSIEYIDSFLFSGQVHEVTYDPKAKRIEIHVVNIEPIPWSKSAMKEATDEAPATTLH